MYVWWFRLTNGLLVPFLTKDLYTGDGVGGQLDFCQNVCRPMILAWWVCHLFDCRIIGCRLGVSPYFGGVHFLGHGCAFLGGVSYCIILLSTVLVFGDIKRAILSITVCFRKLYHYDCHLFLPPCSAVAWIFRFSPWLFMIGNNYSPCIWSWTFLAVCRHLYSCYLNDVSVKCSSFIKMNCL